MSYQKTPYERYCACKSVKAIDKVYQSLSTELQNRYYADYSHLRDKLEYGSAEKAQQARIKMTEGSN